MFLHSSHFFSGRNYYRLCKTKWNESENNSNEIEKKPNLHFRAFNFIRINFSVSSDEFHLFKFNNTSSNESFWSIHSVQKQNVKLIATVFFSAQKFEFSFYFVVFWIDCCVMLFHTDERHSMQKSIYFVHKNELKTKPAKLIVLMQLISDQFASYFERCWVSLSQFFHGLI